MGAKNTKEKVPVIEDSKPTSTPADSKPTNTPVDSKPGLSKAWKIVIAMVVLVILTILIIVALVFLMPPITEAVGNFLNDQISDDIFSKIGL